jgi:amino acid transporter
MAPWAFLIAGVAILATGNTMSEFSRSIPSAGSFVTFIGRGIGARAPRTGQVLAGVSYYMLMICYPVTVGAVVVFMGSWVSSLAGWGHVGWLLATNRSAFRPVRHVLIPLIGSAVLVYGVWEFVQPSQPPPANVFWAWILAIVLVTVAATAIVHVRRPAALQRAATAGPEYITQDAR